MSPSHYHGASEVLESVHSGAGTPSKKTETKSSSTMSHISTVPGEAEFRKLKSEYEYKDRELFDDQNDRMTDYERCVKSNPDELRYILARTAKEFYPSLPSKYYQNERTMCASIPLLLALADNEDALDALRQQAEKRDVKELYSLLKKTFH